MRTLKPKIKWLVGLVAVVAVAAFAPAAFAQTCTSIGNCTNANDSYNSLTKTVTNSFNPSTTTTTDSNNDLTSKTSAHQEAANVAITPQSNESYGNIAASVGGAGGNGGTAGNGGSVDHSASSSGDT